jgi:large conductance mechanosensitive channel
MLKEFKEFAMKGNVIDLAVAVIIGGAFGKIVTSLVSDVIMPPIGMLVGGIDFSNLVATIKPEMVLESGEAVAAVTINYGMFINTVIDFLIVALAIFVVIKMMSSMKKKEEEKPAEPAGPTEIELLTEIRDSLKK